MQPTLRASSYADRFTLTEHTLFPVHIFLNCIFLVCTVKLPSEEDRTDGAVLGRRGSEADARPRHTSPALVLPTLWANRLSAVRVEEAMTKADEFTALHASSSLLDIVRRRARRPAAHPTRVGLRDADFSCIQPSFLRRPCLF